MSVDLCIKKVEEEKTLYSNIPAGEMAFAMHVLFGEQNVAIFTSILQIETEEDTKFFPSLNFGNTKEDEVNHEGCNVALIFPSKDSIDSVRKGLDMIEAEFDKLEETIQKIKEQEEK